MGKDQIGTLKCICIWIDRGVCLVKNGKYHKNIGHFKRDMGKQQNFYIPTTFKTLLCQKKFRTVPLFIIDAKTSTVLDVRMEGNMEIPYTEKDPATGIMVQKTRTLKAGINLIGEADPTTDLKLNVLIKESFWLMLAKRIKQDWIMILIYAGAGYGVLRFLEIAISMIFMHTGIA